MSKRQVTLSIPICLISLFLPDCCIVTGNRDSSYEEFLEHLKIVGSNGEKECRYGLFDFEYTHQCQGTQEVRH